MKIKEMPKEGRPRERFLRFGVEVLSEAELFAIILRTGYRGENVIDIQKFVDKNFRLFKRLHTNVCSLDF